MLCFVSTLTATAAGIGTGLPFLKMGVGARSIGMGEAFSAAADDASATFYNPACLAFAQQPTLTLMHRQWIGDATTAFLGATLPGETYSFALGINSTGIDGIEAREHPGPATGTFGLHDYAITGTAAYKIQDDLSIGISTRFLFEKLYIEESSGYSFDAGAAYRYDEHLRLALAVTNLGSMSPLSTESTPLPEALRAGAAYGSVLSNEISALVTADALKFFGDDGARFHLGAEGTYDSVISVRCGYQFGYEAKGLSTGFGVRYGILAFDYAYVPFSESLGDMHTFSLSFRLR